jgi:hypothetical protein
MCICSSSTYYCIIHINIHQCIINNNKHIHTMQSTQIFTWKPNAGENLGIFSYMSRITFKEAPTSNSPTPTRRRLQPPSFLGYSLREAPTPQFSGYNQKESTTPYVIHLQPEGGYNHLVLRLQLEGSSNSLILWHQPEGGYNPLSLPRHVALKLNVK